MQSSRDVEKLISSSNQGRNVGMIVDRIMDVHYGGKTREVTFDDLIEWPMWQTFVKMYSKFYTHYSVSQLTKMQY